MVNAYELLGVSEQASEAEIKSAYRRRALLHHPDRGGKVENFIRLKRAFDVLAEPEKREHLGLIPLFEPIPLRIQPSMTQATSQLFQNLDLLKDQIRPTSLRNQG